MEEFVQLKLKSYNELHRRSEELDVAKEEHLKYVEEITQLAEKVCEGVTKLHQHILGSELKRYNLKEHTLEDVTNSNCWLFGMSNYEELLELGITEEEMIDFITKKWNEMHQGEQENA